MANIKTFNGTEITKLRSLFSSFTDKTKFTWLNGRNASDAFVICIGAGPWKFKRRQTIQQLALEKLANKDLSELLSCNWYPLDWQNKFVTNMVKHLKKNKVSMDKFCSNINSRFEIYKAVGQPKGTKVLSLFCRDALAIPSFPIDRHVKRLLIKHNLPADENNMLKLCEMANINPCEMAVACVRAASDMDNPDWSIK